MKGQAMERPAFKRRGGQDGTAGVVVVVRPPKPPKPGAIALSVVAA